MPIKFRSIFKKKRRPIDVLGNIKRPHLEEAYVKFPGQKLKSVSEARGTHYVVSKDSLIHKLQKQYGKRHTHIHTHPGDEPLPSATDITKFLELEDRKTAIIVPLDKKHVPRGYFVMKKHGSNRLSEADKERLSKSIQSYRQSALSDCPQDMASILKDIAHKYGFSYRFFPVQGVVLSENCQGFQSSRTSFRTAMSMLALMFLSLSILFGMSRMTGYVISGLSSNTARTISVILFLIGLYLAGVVLFAGNNMVPQRRF